METTQRRECEGFGMTYHVVNSVRSGSMPWAVNEPVKEQMKDHLGFLRNLTLFSAQRSDC